MVLRGVLLMSLFTAVAVAAPAPPRWTKVPHDKYRCTRYAPGRPGGELSMFAPPGKPMIFTMGAASSDRSKVSYRAEGLPAGAVVDMKTGRFTWNIPKTATGTSAITLVAETTAGGKATYAFKLTIASPDLVAAWRAGMGAFEPDCQNFIVDWDTKDVDGDGQTDLLWVTGDTTDDSANSGSYMIHIRRRVGAKFDTVTRDVADGNVETITTPDGKPAITVSKSCCCQANMQIMRVTPTGIEELGRVGGEECRGYQPLDLITDAKGRLEKIIERSGEGSERTIVWRKGAYEPE